MPHCVVKGCRNHSRFMKKMHGITYHIFPRGNEVWRNDWIQIIRESRGDDNWTPSKTSVICSDHFETNDTYWTKQGTRRIVTYAVPKMNLFESGVGPCKQCSTKQKSDGLVQNSSVSADPIGCGQGHVNDGQPDNFVKPISLRKIKAEFEEQTSTPLAVTETCPQIVNVKTEPQEQGDFIVFAEVWQHNDNIKNSPKEVSGSAMNTSIHNRLEQPAKKSNFVESSLRKRCLRRLQENLLRNKTLVQIQKKKIRTLTELVNRLRIRNKHLKEMLKSFKQQTRKKHSGK